MATCPLCAMDLAPNGRFCPSCGASSQEVTSAATMAMSISSSGVQFDEGRFLPGTLLAERYRILGRLGKGGMGEVYRANDLRLGQTVALKFLPEATSRDPAALARFYNEVRVARQVTHPNVCRVYDLGDLNGQPFISMQFVDGEDLASLLLRIGRLPVDKAVEITRKLCAGLAAAHSQGVLHRDLKPANIMIDGRGQVIIADFGLAGLAAEIAGSDIRSGSPAYMSPEQLAGKEVTIKSDLYSLGLVMYEVFTGKRAFEADTLADLVRLQEESRPAQISTTVHDMDPAVERVILKCLDPEPSNRPSSALAIAAALPGGDPLAAALAAGETPSPEMVAASGAQEALRPWIAIACLVVSLAGLAGIILFNASLSMAARANLETPPDALAVQAHNLIQQFGYKDRVVDRAWGIEYTGSYIRYLESKSNQVHDWNKVVTGQPSPIYFWYRESPRPLEAVFADVYGRVSAGDPPLTISGMTQISIDPLGRLISFNAVPPQLDTASAPSQAPDPAPLFTAAGLSLSEFQPATPQWTPLVATDSRAAWTGIFPGRPESPIRIEVAWWHAKPVYFQIVGPWTQPARMAANAVRNNNDTIFFIMSILVVVFGSFLAWRNLRLGRGDRQGALRLAGFTFVVAMLAWALRTHGVTSAGYGMWVHAFGEALWNGAQLWLAYVALEPFVRRRWPRILVSWTRIVSGRWRDPLVGRDVLIGILGGLAYVLSFSISAFFQIRQGSAPATNLALETLLGIRPALSNLGFHLLNSMTGALLFFMFFFLLRLVLRKEWLAGIVMTLLFSLSRGVTDPHPFIVIPAYLFIYGMVVPILLRFGLLSLIVIIFVTDSTLSLAFTTNFSAWYGAGSLVLVFVVVGMAIVSFRSSLGGQKVLAGLLEQ